MVIPVHDVVPVRRTPWVTYLLIAADVVIFLFTPAARDTGVEAASLSKLCRQEAFYDRYAAIPREMAENKELPAVPTDQIGVRGTGASCVIGPPAYHKIPALSVLYSMFLHGSWLRLLGNMLFLWVFGNNVEDRLGRVRYLLFYLLAGYVAAYGFAVVTRDVAQPLVGASGAVSAVSAPTSCCSPGTRVEPGADPAVPAVAATRMARTRTVVRAAMCVLLRVRRLGGWLGCLSRPMCSASSSGSSRPSRSSDAGHRTHTSASGPDPPGADSRSTYRGKSTPRVMVARGRRCALRTDRGRAQVRPRSSSRGYRTTDHSGRCNQLAPGQWRVAAGASRAWRRPL
jgi:membrane associated rhomboid family serine protease